MRTISLYITLGLLLVGALLLQGCEEDTINPVRFGNLFGEVLEREDNIAISQATISTNPPTSSVFTDASGRFVLDNIPEGTYSLRAEKNGYFTQVASVSVFGDQDANVIVRLDQDTITNDPPSSPRPISPVDGALDLPVEFMLQWSAMDSDEDDILNYNITLFNFDMSQNRTLLTGSTDTTFTLTDLTHATNYFWQVEVSDDKNPPVLGPVWGFRTKDFPNHRMLFARSTAGKYDIFSADGMGEVIKLTQNSGSSWRPRMNPQRTKIAFISNQNIQPQLYTMDRDGRNVRQVTTVAISGANQLELDFAWSPDGTQLLYMANSALYKINADGSGLNQFAQAPVGFTFAECDWTAQGNFIAYRLVGSNQYESSINILNDQGTTTQTVFPDRAGGTGGPKISIPGTEVLYTHDVSGFESVDGRQLNSRIFTRFILGVGTTDLSINKLNGTNDFDPVYSPDGSQVIFVNTNNDGISSKDIYIMNTDGTDRELMFENAEMPEWK